jgi:D-aminoacyl-tRNA deacylase
VRAVVQRVSRAQVEVGEECVGRVGRGLCVLVGVAQGDTEHDARWLADKIVTARVFQDDAGKLNRSIVDERGSILAVSQFTLLGDLRKGRRPSFSAAMEPGTARRLFDEFCAACLAADVTVETGRFRETMRVELVNEGPVTLLLDSRKAF